MRMTSLVPALFSTLIIVSVGFAQSGAEGAILKGKGLLEEGKNHGNRDRIMEARSLFERVSQDKEWGWLADYYVALSSYRLIDAQNDEFSPLGEDEQLDHIDDAIDRLEKVRKQKEDWAEALALQSTCLGRKSGMKPMTAMFTGPKAGKLIEKARELAPDNPRVIMIQAINLYNTPEMWGGDKEKALELLHRSVEQYETFEPKTEAHPTWGHEEAWTWIGLYHKQKGNKPEARQAFENALEVNPEFGWVKNALLPSLDE